jgi:erythromycin esterase
VALVEWIRRYNENRSNKVGFYGLDVYSLWESMGSIISYLEKIDPEAAETAWKAFSCFEPYGQSAEQYAWNVAMVPETCEREVIDLLLELRRNPKRYDRDSEDAFSAEQNALVLVDAERYYRALVRGGTASWNIRDKHMNDTLDRLVKFHGPDAKAIVWAHNTHVCDARATDMVQAGEFNIGQLVRQYHSRDGVVLVGFATNRGTVVAADKWGAPMEDMKVPSGAPGSWEDVLHQAGSQDKLLILKDKVENMQWMETRGHRAIGVVYNPAFERYGNYIPTSLPQRYDALLYIDESHSLHQMHVVPAANEPPELYPWGI